MADLKKYNPKEVDFIFDGINLSAGIIDGTFITVARNVRQFSLNVGGDGGGTRVESNNLSGVVAITVRKGSPTNALLTGRIGIVKPLMVKDNSSAGTLHKSPEAFLDGPPDDEFSTEESDVVWTFLCLVLGEDIRGGLAAS